MTTNVQNLKKYEERKKLKCLEYSCLLNYNIDNVKVI